jgi:hypothetical protein
VRSLKKDECMVTMLSAYTKINEQNIPKCKYIVRYGYASEEAINHLRTILYNENKKVNTTTVSHLQNILDNVLE